MVVLEAEVSAQRDSEVCMEKKDNKQDSEKRQQQVHDKQEVAEETSEVFALRVSQTLSRKIKQKAADEGISPHELACELIAEGLVLRAWEIMERKSTMRSAPSGNYKSNNRYRGGGEQKGRKNFNKANRAEKHAHILEDRAAFVEYVRNQEKNRK